MAAASKGRKFVDKNCAVYIYTFFLLLLFILIDGKRESFRFHK